MTIQKSIFIINLGCIIINYPTKGNNGNYIAGRHAEIGAISKLKPQDFRKLILVNIRIDNNGELNQGKPCKNCERVIRKIGLKKVFYSDSDGKIQELI